jgi:hypothetical protein
MAKLVFIGAANAISQIDTIVAGGTWSAGETATIQVGNKKITYTVITGDTPALVAAGLLALLQASSAPEVKEIAWSLVSATITATGTPGLPSTIVASETAASGTLTLTSVQVATGPNHWNNTLNWSTGAVPVNTDEVYIDEDYYSVLYGLPTAGSALTLAKFGMKRGQLGLPDRNQSGYNEYRATRAVFTCLDVNIGTSGGSGPKLARIDLVSGASVVGIFGSNVRSDFGAVDILLNNSSATVAVTGGQFVSAYSGDEVSVIGSVIVSSSGIAYIGTGCTVTTLSTSGTTVIDGAVTTCNVYGGTATRRGTLTTLAMTSGTFTDLATTTITTATIENATYDRSKDVRPVTITTLNLNKGGIINNPRPITIGTFAKGASVSTISAT